MESLTGKIAEQSTSSTVAIQTDNSYIRDQESAKLKEQIRVLERSRHQLH